MTSIDKIRMYSKELSEVLAAKLFKNIDSKINIFENSVIQRMSSSDIYYFHENNRLHFSITQSFEYDKDNTNYVGYQISLLWLIDDIKTQEQYNSYVDLLREMFDDYIWATKDMDKSFDTFIPIEEKEYADLNYLVSVYNVWIPMSSVMYMKDTYINFNEYDFMSAAITTANYTLCPANYNSRDNIYYKSSVTITPTEIISEVENSKQYCEDNGLKGEYDEIFDRLHDYDGIIHPEDTEYDEHTMKSYEQIKGSSDIIEYFVHVIHDHVIKLFK